MSLVRPLRPEDEAQWRELWRGYLDFYEVENLAEEVTQTTFERLLNDERFFSFVTEKNGALIGFVHCVTHPATWTTKLSCYLEDLYVSKEARGTGVGRALIEKAYEEAKERGCDRVYWHTHEGNARARKLYDKVASLTGFVHYRVTF